MHRSLPNLRCATRCHAVARSIGRVLTFRLGSRAAPPPVEPYDPTPPPPPSIEASAEELRRGLDFDEWCSVCHGLDAFAGGVVPDLRHANAATHGEFREIVFGGTRAAKGMPAFADVLDDDAVRRSQAHVLQRTRDTQPKEVC